jgi:uncharacterized membrane protein
MNYDQFKVMRIVTAMIVAIIMSFAVTLHSWILAIADVLLAIVIIFAAKKQVKDVLADERDYYIAGKAARYALSIFCIIEVIFAFYFMVLSKDTNAEVIGSVLAYSTCGLLLLNSLIVVYLQRNEK